MARLVDADLLINQFLTRYTEREKQGNFTFVACEIKQDFVDMMEEIYVSCSIIDTQHKRKEDKHEK